MLFLPPGILQSPLPCAALYDSLWSRAMVYTLAFPKEGFYSKDMQAIGWFFMRLREVGELQILDQCYDLLKVTRPAGGQIFRTV